MSNVPLTDEQRKKRIDATLKIVALSVVGFIVSPFILHTIAGLAGLVVCGMLGFTTLALTPVFTMKVANWRLKLIKAEAWKNPTETLRNEQGKREEALKEASMKLQEMKGRIRSFRSKIGELRAKISSDKLAEMQNVAVSLDGLYSNRLQKYENARVKLLEFGNLIEQAEAEWEVSVAARDATAAFNTGEDPLSTLKVGASLAAIQTNLGAAMAALDTELADQNAEQRIMTSSLPVSASISPIGTSGATGSKVIDSIVAPETLSARQR